MAGHIFRFARRESNAGEVVDSASVRQRGVHVQAPETRQAPPREKVAADATAAAAQPRLALRDWLEHQGKLDPKEASALFNSSFLLLDEARSTLAAARDQLTRERREATAAQAAVEHRLAEMVTGHTAERESWADDRRRLTLTLEETELAVRNLERENARQSSRLEEAAASRTRTESAGSQVEKANEELRGEIVAERGKAALLERRLEHEQVIAKTELDALRNALAAANAQIEDQRRQASELAHAREAMLGQAELMRSLLDAREDHRAALASEAAPKAPAAIAAQQQHAPSEWMRAMLFLDGVEHFHGFLDGEELPELVARLARVKWIAWQCVTRGEPGTEPDIGETGIPVVQFLFGALPGYLFNAPGEWEDAFDGDPHGAGAPDVGQAHLHLEKLLQFQHVLGRFTEHGFTTRAIVAPSRLDGTAHRTAPWSGIADDPLTALAGVYAELELCCRDGGPGATAAWINEVVHESPWDYVDGERVDPATQLKLLYLLTRTANSFQICLLELFGQIQTLQGEEAAG